MDRSKRDRQGGQRRVDVEGKTDSESTSFDGSLRDKSEAGALERMGSAATMDFSPETGGGGESFQARFHRNVGERKVRAKIDSPRSGSVGISPGVDVEEQVRPRSIRPSGGKDRHSKVQTAKGLRDRRVRLSVATAIQFYDVQDRLGYDQPSKAVEWLLKKAKSAIDELPPVQSPNSAAATAVAERPASLLRASSGSTATCPLAPPASYATAAGAFAARFYPHVGAVSTSSSKERDQGEEEQVHEQSVLETSMVREAELLGKGDGQGSPMARLESRVKARERARERMKEKTTGSRDGRDGTSKSISSPPYQSPFPTTASSQLQRTLQLQQSSGNLESTSMLGGAGESMAYSSFTSLLQSPLHQPFQSLPQVLPLQQQQQQQQQQDHGAAAGHHLYHQSQFVGPPQHSSFQQALLQAASMEPASRQFIHSPYSQPPAPAGSVHHSFSFPSAVLTSPLDFASSYSTPPPGSLSLSQLAALGILTSGNQQFPSESAFVSSTPHFRSNPLLAPVPGPALAFPPPSAMLEESPSSYSIPGLLRPQFSFPYANLPNVSLPLQSEPYQSSSGYAPHHFVSGFDRGASGPRELRVSAPAIYQTVYQSGSSHQLPGILQGVDEEIGELKNRSSSPPPRPP